MNLTLIILTVVLVINLVAPFAVFYAIKLAKRKEFLSHKKMQNIIFYICFFAVFTLEGLIRFSGGSGSLTQNSSFSGTVFFRILLLAHIIGAVLTYGLWAYQTIASNRKFKKQLPGTFSQRHKRLGYIVFIGLIYTALTALAVYVLLWI